MLLKVVTLIRGRTEQKRVRFPPELNWEGQGSSPEYTQPRVMGVLVAALVALLMGMSWGCSRQDGTEDDSVTLIK